MNPMGIILIGIVAGMGAMVIIKLYIVVIRYAKTGSFFKESDKNE